MSFADHDVIALPDDLRATVESELRAGERVDWMDQPIPGLMARKAWPIVCFGAVWTGVVVMSDLFWLGLAWKSTDGLFSVVSLLFSIPPLAIGVGMLSAPFWMRRMARRTVYVITDRRAILFGSTWRGVLTVRAFEPDQLNNLKRNQAADGTGDLVLAQNVWKDSDGDTRSADVGFLGVRDVKAVEDRVRTLAEQSQG